MLPLLFLTAARPDAADDAYRKAVDRQRAGDLAGAIQLYRECLTAQPFNYQARSNLGAALSGLARFDEAIESYQAALESAPENFRPMLRRNIGLAYYKSGRMAEALAKFGELLAEHPGDRDLTLLAADCYLQLDQPAKAVEALQPLRGSVENDRAAAWVLGMALLRNGDTAEAQRVLDAILRDTNSAESNFAIGLATFLRGDYPAATAAFAHAADLNSSLPRLYSYYGQALLFSGDPQKASEAFRKQLSLDANDFDANYQLAEILASEGRFHEAEPLLRRAVLLRPASDAARSALNDTIAGRFQRAAPARIGIAPGSPAPAVEVQRMNAGAPIRLPAIESGRPAVLVFGSYTCPQFRSAAPTLNDLAAKYAGKIPFLLVYIREAHSAGQWQSTINEREQVSLKPAATCTRSRTMPKCASASSISNSRPRSTAWRERRKKRTAPGPAACTSSIQAAAFDFSGLSEVEFDAKRWRRPCGP